MAAMRLTPEQAAALDAYWAGSAGASAATTRKAITTRLREHCEQAGLTYAVGSGDKGQIVVIISGESMTPGQAERRYLNGR